MATSWLSIPRGSHFSLSNIPFGIVSSNHNPKPRPAIAIGDYAFCLQPFAQSGGFSKLKDIETLHHAFEQPTLNEFASLGRPVTGMVRKYLQRVFASDTEFPEVLKDQPDLQKLCLHPLRDIAAHLPFSIGDYTDFYAGLHHAYNVGVLFRGPQNALQPNYKHLPVGYHGRASSIVPSGTLITRPSGQILQDPSAEIKTPILAPSRRLDIELELGAFVAAPNPLGESVPIHQAADHIFGYVLLNDWSARDIQAWEYVPLGPFNGKNFATSISTWVVHADAMQPFLVRGLPNDTQLLDYLKEKSEETHLDVKLEVDITTPSGHTTTISRTSSRNLLFSFPQMLAHHTLGGCPMHAGDLLGSGTISGDTRGSEGSLLEQSQGGKHKIALKAGETRTFLQDGDTVTLRGWAGSDEDHLVGFGTCAGTIRPARSR